VPKKRGGEYPTSVIDAAGVPDDEKFQAEFGYGITTLHRAGVEFSKDPNEAVTSNLKPAELLAYGNALNGSNPRDRNNKSCRNLPPRESQFPELGQIAKDLEKQTAFFENTPEIHALYAAWGRCFEEETGLFVEKPDDVFTYLVNKTNSDIQHLEKYSEEEMALSHASLKCEKRELSELAKKKQDFTAKFLSEHDAAISKVKITWPPDP
jgi:hypothetical protein